MFKYRLLHGGIFLVLLFSIGTLAFADTVKAKDQRVSIQFDFRGEIESNKIVPRVSVHSIDLTTGERKEENFFFEDQAFSPPLGSQVNERGDVEQITKDAAGETFFRMYTNSYTVNTSEGLKGYALYTGKSYKEKVVDEWHTFEEDGIDRERLYVFDYGTKELNLLKESTLQKKLPTITYSLYTDSRTKEKFKDMDYWDYIYSGTAIGTFINSDLYMVANHSSKETRLYSLSHNTYVATVPIDYEGLLTTKSLNLCTRGNNCFKSEESTSFNDNVVFKKGGKYYEIITNHSIREINKTKDDWEQYQWRIIVNNHVFGQRRINGWDYIISSDNNKVKKLSERYTFVRDVTVSPDHKYLAIFEASYNKEKSDHSYEDEQVRIYDINKQKEIRKIKLPYRDTAPQDIFWHSNTVLQYRPNSSRNEFYIRNVNVEILSGIITKDLIEAYDDKDEYIIDAADKDKYFTFVRPLEIRYQGKSIKYTKQPSFEGENSLVYCSLKDLANGIGAGIKVDSGTVKLTLNGKTATVDLRDKQVITYDGTAYAPIKAIVLKLGLQYKREDLFATQINLD